MVHISRQIYILGDKTNPNKFKKIEIMHGVLSDHNGIKLETNNKKVRRESPNT